MGDNSSQLGSLRLHSADMHGEIFPQLCALFVLGKVDLGVDQR